MKKDNFDECLQVIGKYLEFSGWKHNMDFTSNNFGFWIDPITEQSYRSDHAFTIQSDRNIWESHLRKEHLKKI